MKKSFKGKIRFSNKDKIPADLIQVLPPPCKLLTREHFKVLVLLEKRGGNALKTPMS